MFEAKAAWKRDRENDELLQAFNKTTARVQDLAFAANSEFKSTGLSRYSIVLKASMALLGDLRKVSGDFFESNGQTSFEVRKKIHSVESLTNKLIGRLSDPTAVESRGLLRKKLEQDQNENVLKEMSTYHGGQTVLLAILADVKSHEKTFSFQRKLWLQKKAMASSMNCSIDQFS